MKTSAKCPHVVQMPSARTCQAATNVHVTLASLVTRRSLCVKVSGGGGRVGQDWTEQGRAGQGMAGQGRARQVRQVWGIKNMVDQGITR